jgi:hypothetical protein
VRHCPCAMHAAPLPQASTGWSMLVSASLSAVQYAHTLVVPDSDGLRPWSTGMLLCVGAAVRAAGAGPQRAHAGAAGGAAVGPRLAAQAEARHTHPQVGPASDRVQQAGVQLPLPASSISASVARKRCCDTIAPCPTAGRQSTRCCTWRMNSCPKQSRRTRRSSGLTSASDIAASRRTGARTVLHFANPAH